MRTYYDVLGVAADTPDVVIKAAFRALAKEYHPDRANADPGDTDKFIEIQTAYAVLSKPHSRSEYDAELRDAFAAPELAGMPDGGGMPAPVPWPTTTQAATDIERICARLGLYSEALAQSFHDAYLRGECGDDPRRFAGEMEKDFFREYFGDDPDVQSFAKLLLLGSRTAAALTLNQLVAGASPPGAGDIRSILQTLLDQHFADEALFTEWLKVKFGVLPAGPRPVSPARPVGVAAPAAPVAAVSSAAATSHPLRPMALVFVWAVALYFVLFAALPMLQ
jgi:curved DNA-binding protein CbpA